MRWLIVAVVAAALIGTIARTARADDVLPPPGPVDVPITTTEITVIDEPDPYGIDWVDPDSGVTYPHGCKQVDVSTEIKSAVFRTQIYRFHQIKHWCWQKNTVYDERHSWQFNGSATACLDTVYPANAWFFAWNGNPQGGHYSEERAHVTNCIFKVGAWREYYPDVKVRAHANGSYDYSTQN